MRKVLVIAGREYKAAVRSKAFIISLLLMPILMAASVAIQFIMKKFDDTSEKTYAIIDRSPDSKLFDFLEKAAAIRNEFQITDSETGKQDKPKFKLVKIEPSSADKEAIDKQRLELSHRVEKEEFQGFLEIGPKVFEYPDPPDPKAKPKEEATIRYQSNKPTSQDFYRWAEAVVNRGIQQKRFEVAKLPEAKVQAIQQAVPVRQKGLTKVDKVTGEIKDASDESQIANFLVPAALIGLMFSMVFIGATPAMQGVVEEKMQRIAEVLLGSVNPFQLMLGKLVGMIGVSLTVGAFYLGGGYFLASRYNLTEFLSAQVIAWFLVYQVLAVLMYGSLFLAIGSAASDMKETQSLLMPVLIIAIMPMLLIGPIITEPNSAFATVCSLIPPSTPMLMTARISVPPGVAWWQPIAGIVGVMATTLLCVYAAGRIFRVGILMQGKGAKYGDLVRWVIRG